MELLKNNKYHRLQMLIVMGELVMGLDLFLGFYMRLVV
jgi:hypothetical protein